MSPRLSAALVANVTFFNALPQAAREQVRETLGEIARDILTAQQAAAPVYAGKARKGVTPGLLKQSLTIAEAFEHLRVRVGYPDLKGRKSKLFYAVIQEYGRQARTTPVRRLKRGARPEWRKRIRAGTARAGLKPQDLLSAGREMRVGAVPPRPFVHLEERFGMAIDAAIAGFWERVEERV
jgi:hypothetical protein